MTTTFCSLIIETCPQKTSKRAGHQILGIVAVVQRIYILQFSVIEDDFYRMKCQRIYGALFIRSGAFRYPLSYNISFPLLYSTSQTYYFQIKYSGWHPTDLGFPLHFAYLWLTMCVTIFHLSLWAISDQLLARQRRQKKFQTVCV